MTRLVCAVACGLACALSARPARAQAGVELTGPQLVIGDGKTEVALRVARTRRGSGRPRAITSAGTIARIERIAGGGHEVTLIPPRVAEEMTVTVSIGSASHSLRVIPPRTETGRQLSHGPYDMAGPARLFLGERTPVTIRMRIERRQSLPTLITSAGAIGPLQRDAGDVWTATYQPPAEMYPQLAFVVAVSPDGSRLDHLAIPLYGRATVALRSEPNASIGVLIGDDEYGPVRTDRRGRAELAVAAPPGVNAASAIARDRVGNEKRRRLNLDPPALSPLFAACPPSGDRVYVFSVTEAGRPRSDVKLDLSAAAGSFAEPARRAPGVFEVGYTGPRDAELTAAVRGRRSSRASCRPAAFGNSRGRELWLSLRAGYLSDLDQVSGPLLTVGIDYRGMVGSLELGAGIETGIVIGSVDPEPPDPGDSERAVAVPLLVKLTAGVPLGRFVPYVAVELGGAVVNHDEDLSFRPAFGGGLGLGIELGSRASVGVDAGYLHIALGDPIAGEDHLGGFHAGAGCGVRF